MKKENVERIGQSLSKEEERRIQVKKKITISSDSAQPLLSVCASDLSIQVSFTDLDTVRKFSVCFIDISDSTDISIF